MSGTYVQNVQNTPKPKFAQLLSAKSNISLDDANFTNISNFIPKGYRVQSYDSIRLRVFNSNLISVKRLYTTGRMIDLIILLLRRVLSYNYASLLKHRFILTNYLIEVTSYFHLKVEPWKRNVINIKRGRKRIIEEKINKIEGRLRLVCLS